MKCTIRSVNLDASESAFVGRQLDVIMSTLYSVDYPELKAQRLIPVTSEAGPGATSLTYREYDQTGLMQFISNYASNLPRADVQGKEVTTLIKAYGNAYGYNIDEIRSAQLAGIPLSSMKAKAARDAYEQMVNRVAWLGDSECGILGFLYSANISKVASAYALTNSATTADQMIATVNAWIALPITLTKGIEMPDTVLLPIAAWRALATKRIDSLNMTVLKYLQENNPFITTWEWVADFDSVAVNPRTGAVSTTSCAIVYRKAADKVRLEIPVPFEQFPPQEKGLEFEIPCHAKVAGVMVFKPLGIVVIDGVN